MKKSYETKLNTNNSKLYPYASYNTIQYNSIVKWILNSERTIYLISWI